MPLAEWLDEAARELRYAARSLAERPLVSLTCMATLAVCLGANAAFFGLVDAVLLRPLPYPHPERLAEVITEERENGIEESEDSQTGRTWFLLRDQARGFDAAASSALAAGVNVAIGGRPEYLRQERVGSGFFRVLGIAPLVGREFSADEDRPAGPPAVLLSHSLWKRRFGGDRAVLGRVVVIQGEPHTVVGVMPRELVTTSGADLWTPLAPATTGEGADENYRITVRLRPGTTWAAAAAEVAAVGPAAFAERRAREPSLRLALVPLQRGLTAELRAPLFVLWAAAATVLLIGCANIASLLLARGASRAREIAIRVALGAERRAIVRQLLAESLLLVAFGSLGGLLLGAWGLASVGFLAQDGLHLWQRVALDGRVLAAVLAVALPATLVFGLLPAAQLGRVDVRAALGEGGEESTGGRPHRFRRLLVVAEVALGVVLLVGAGLFLRTFQALRSLPPGFDPHHVITAQMSLADARYATSRRVNGLFAESLDRIRALPGVTDAAVGLALPYERHLRLGFRFLDGQEARGPRRNTTLTYVTPGYFAALRIPLVRGRLMRDGDTPAAERVALVNQAFARRYLAGGDPVGRHIEMAGVGRRIVGVVADFQQETGGSRDLGPLAALPAAFFPAAQADDEMLRLAHTWFSPSWIVRTAGPPGTAAAGIRRAVEAVDPQLPIASFRTMEEVERRATAEQRVQAVLLATLAIPALFLAALGIYGLICQSVIERAKEVGIRIALGATRGQTVRAVALPGIRLAAAGVLLGWGLAGLAARSLEHLIWGVPATDPGTFGGVAAGLLAVAAAASLLPTLRLARIDPAATLRLAGESAGGGLPARTWPWLARRLTAARGPAALERFRPAPAVGARGGLSAGRRDLLVWVRRPSASRQTWAIPAGRTLASFDFGLQPSQVARSLDELRTCDWIRQRRRALIQGPPGSGKSHLAAGLGAAAIERGFSVAFLEVDELVRAMAKDAAYASRILRWTFPRHDLLIIDRFSYRELGRPEAGLVVELIRCRDRSTLVTTRDQDEDWSPGDGKVAEALSAYRLNRCHVVKTARPRA